MYNVKSFLNQRLPMKLWHFLVLFLVFPKVFSYMESVIGSWVYLLVALLAILSIKSQSVKTFFNKKKAAKRNQKFYNI